MKHRTLAGLALLLLLVAPGLSGAPAAPRTLRGSYRWEQGDETGKFKAEFKPAGELHWDVSFRFRFGGNTHIYVGTADGRLDSGVLEGRVESDGRKRVFLFKGEFKNGKFSGTHAELSGGREYRTGTLTLGG